jgi:hypothetical protein
MTLLRDLLLRRGLPAAFLVATGAAGALGQQTTSVVRHAPPPKPAAQAQQATDRKPGEAKPLVARYDIGHIVKRLAALEAQVAELKKKNAALESQIAAMKLKDSLPAGGMHVPGTSVQDRLKSLEIALRNHTHYMPNIGVMALNALPGMQDIANKSGVGHVIEQWKGIKMHVSFGSGGGLDRTGLPILPGQ